jgi:hypothetical protein
MNMPPFLKPVLSASKEGPRGSTWLTTGSARGDFSQGLCQYRVVRFQWVGEPPVNIVQVWLIALSIFRHQEGQGKYGTIEFLTGDKVVIVN